MLTSMEMNETPSAKSTTIHSMHFNEPVRQQLDTQKISDKSFLSEICDAREAGLIPRILGLQKKKNLESKWEGFFIR